ncbi:MAG: FAD-dependent oxidoreductase [Actinomycetota bacterium]
MPRRSFDAIVVGAGVVGAATARALARRNNSVALLEQFAIGHNRGSSHGAARIFRFSYPDSLFVGMAMEALPLWRELEAEVGEELLVTTGGLDIGKGVEKNAQALESCGAPFETMTGAEAMARWPVISLAPDEPVLLQADGGITRADRCVRAFVTSAAAAGAEVMEHTKVLELQVTNGRAEIVTTNETLVAPVVVVTAGAWARDLLATAGIDLSVTPTRETVAYYKLDEVPPTLVDWGDPAVYALWSPGLGLKAGEHIAGPEADPDEDGAPDQSSNDRVSKWVASRYPTAEPTPHFTETCFYTNTADEQFVIERHGPIVVGSACSGHGFKFGPLTGKRLADLALS